jgi:hypothetical protein
VIRRALGEQLWTKFYTWQPPNSYDPATAQAIFLAKEEGSPKPLAPAALARYWAEGRSTGAQADASAAARPARWEIAGILEALNQELEHQRVALPGGLAH